MPDQAEIHRRTQSKDRYVRRKAAEALGEAFNQIPDKASAWQDLHMLVQDEDRSVRRYASYALETAFGQVPDKSQAWQDLVRLVQDGNCRVQESVARALGAAFGQISDKSQAWQDLVRLVQDEDHCVRENAAYVLGRAFGQIPDKSQAWQDLVRLVQDEDHSVRWNASRALETAFGQIPDKSQAWQDLHMLVQDENHCVRENAAYVLGRAFGQIPDKSQAWQDLHMLVQDENHSVRWNASRALETAFGRVPDKSQAWQDLHMLVQDEDRGMRRSAAYVLGTAFGRIPDKSQAWQDLIRLTQDEDSSVRRYASYALETAFGQVPDKSQAWQDLIRLTQDEDSRVQESAARALETAFGQIPDKSQAWQDLIKLTQDEDSRVQNSVARALKTAFGQVLDKSQAWQDLHRLTQDEDSRVQESATIALGKVFGQVPDKFQAWMDLHRLVQDRYSDVRRSAAVALGKVFGQVPDKARVWMDLVRLTQDEDSSVRMYAYHSLGKASVFKATESNDKDTMKKELEAAIAFFEKSSQESEYGPAGPARFCCPFYRSYLAMTFQKAKEDEVQRYLATAKEAVGGSEGKDGLLKAVENLARALQEAQRLKDRPLHEIASELNAYRWYCDKAGEYMAAAEDKAPGAVKLMKMCNPFLEEQILATIAEIREKAKQICQITHGSGTEYEALGAEIHEAAKVFSEGNLVSIQRCSVSIVKQLKKFCRLLPVEEKDQVCKDVEEIQSEPDLPEKLHLIERALLNLGPILERHMPLVDVVIITVLPEEYKGVLNKLSNIIPPQDLDANIYAWKFGKISCPNYKGNYKVAIGRIGRAGTTQGALAATNAVQLWRPRCVIFSGIAGGLPDPEEIDAHPRLGDVVVADIIYGYEYGKIDKKFKPRTNWIYRTDQGLLNGAGAYALSDGWQEHIEVEPPEKCTPKVVNGKIASGDQVVDDPTNDFFAQVLKTWPEINAVEMEGAGAAAAIEQAGCLGISTRFMMIRGISDLPRAKGQSKGTKERDAWKTYASDVAAAFIIGWIADGLPLRPLD